MPDVIDANGQARPCTANGRRKANVSKAKLDRYQANDLLGFAYERHRSLTGRMDELQGFFEFEFGSEDMKYLATVEIAPPGIKVSEAKTRPLAEWLVHFAISAPIEQAAIKFINFRPLNGKPDDALKVPKGHSPVLIWKSVEV